MSEREWYEEFYKLCKEHSFDVYDYWGYLKIKTKTDTWYIPQMSEEPDYIMGKVLVLHHNARYMSPKSLLPDTHVQFKKEIEPKSLVKYFHHHQKKVLVLERKENKHEINNL